MRILLDTCTFLWISVDSPKLSKTARSAYLDVANEVFLSVASAWEITVKNGIGRLPLPMPADRFVADVRRRHQIETLPIDEESVLSIGRLEKLHRDPFDRLLVSQAIVHGMVLLTPDPLIAQYPARQLW